MLTKEELQERAQIVRIFEAACQLEHPTPEEVAFRSAIMKKLGLEYHLKEVRSLTLVPAGRPLPVAQVSKPTQTSKSATPPRRD